VVEEVVGAWVVLEEPEEEDDESGEVFWGLVFWGEVFEGFEGEVFGGEVLAGEVLAGEVTEDAFGDALLATLVTPLGFSFAPPTVVFIPPWVAGGIVESVTGFWGFSASGSSTGESKRRIYNK